ncbi:MAG: peptide ABC transporter substrate-binding protein, partial [Clostridium sp.]|nr:peptide ABC transporter substrate-binding protein [Clostridium sp.]
EAPVAYFLSLMAFPTYFPVRQDMVEKDVNLWWADKETHVSNGPFKFESLAPKSKLVLVKNDNYYDADKVKLKTIEMSLTDDAQTFLASFKKGELDMIEAPPPQDIPQLLKDKVAQVMPYLGTYFYVINMRPELKDKNPEVYEALQKPEVRRALALGLNKTELVEKVAMGEQTPAWAYVPEGIKDHEGNNFADKTKYLDKDAGDFEEAKRLLTEAGYPNGEGFPTITLKYNNNTTHQNMAVAVQAMWKQNLGIDIELANEEWAVFQTSRINGDYEIARHGWIADYNDPMTFLDMWVSGEGPGVWGNNDAHYDNPEYDRLIAEAKVETDLPKRTQMMHDAQDLLMEDLPVIPIYFYTNVVAYRDYVKEVRKSPLGFLFFENAYIEE